LPVGQLSSPPQWPISQARCRRCEHLGQLAPEVRQELQDGRPNADKVVTAGVKAVLGECGTTAMKMCESSTMRRARSASTRTHRFLGRLYLARCSTLIGLGSSATRQAKGTGRGFSLRRRPERPMSRGTGVLASSGQMGAHDEEEDGQALQLAAQRSEEREGPITSD
jgi:hypothetical protein